MATNSNETYDPKAKTTKLVRGIHSWIKFQKHQGVESLTIEGKQALADVSQDKNGDASLVLKADRDKVDYVQSNVPYLLTSHKQDGTDPYQEKTAVISQDLTQFPLRDGELVTVEKAEGSLTIHDGKVKEFVTTTVTAKETELKEFVNTTLSAKETELKEYVDQHGGGGQGVTPNYVADEIRKAKEELTAEINKHGGSSSNNENLIIYQRLGSFNEPCAKFTLPSVSTMYTAILNVYYKGANDPLNNNSYSHATFYVASNSISNLKQNGVILQQGNASDRVDWDIILPEKGQYTHFELTIFGLPRDVNETKYPYQLNIIGDTSYTPAPVPQ